jgi:hypothetical protein
VSVRVQRILALSAVIGGAALLAMVSLGRAGNSGASFAVAAGPSRISAGAEGFVIATFTPDSGSGTGSATHVVLTIDVPLGFASPHAEDCSGPVNTGNANRFTCTLKNVHKGDTVSRFVTFTAASVTQPTTYTISGTAKFDVPSGKHGNGHGNTLTATSAATAYAANDPNHQGKCVDLEGGSTATVGGSATVHNQKATSADFGAADPSLDLPCTPAAGGVDPDVSLPHFTSGVWFVSLPQLGGDGIGRATLTFYKLPHGTSWKTFQVFEILGYPGDLTVSSNPVPPCAWGGSLPSGQTSCVYSRSSFGYGGVKLVLLVRGSGTDPGYVG